MIYVFLFRGLTLVFFRFPCFHSVGLKGLVGNCCPTTNLGSRPSDVTSDVTTKPFLARVGEEFQFLAVRPQVSHLAALNSLASSLKCGF